eukprot:CAMPEP_0184306494 /NCGR_PEP_ID=MMETSP1049-20130417/15481_1 /TAXON_ID=77928 /ORGANISM="Proteomonas sulcata, Strain CCMP704" /LENGTH=190 /DNA_ID=CAMNT_0026618771 /DNA_START=63 /DNA_END=632 /DNA_ORIENTATION=+
MTTVGYGDEYPSTLLGRVVAVAAALTAVIMLAITINLVISKLTLSRAESKVIEVMDRITLKKDLKEKAAVVIQRWFCAHRFYTRNDLVGYHKSGYAIIPDMRSKRRKNIDLRTHVLSNIKLLEAINEFAELNREVFTASIATDISELVGNVGSKITHQEHRIAALNEKCAQAAELAAELAQALGGSRGGG